MSKTTMNTAKNKFRMRGPGTPQSPVRALSIIADEEQQFGSEWKPERAFSQLRRRNRYKDVSNHLCPSLDISFETRRTSRHQPNETNEGTKQPISLLDF